MLVGSEVYERGPLWRTLAWKTRIPIETKGAIVFLCFGMISPCVRGIAPRRFAQAVTLRVHATSQA